MLTRLEATVQTLLSREYMLYYNTKFDIPKPLIVTRRTMISCFFLAGFMGAGLSIVAMESCFLPPFDLESLLDIAFLLELEELGSEVSRSMRISSPF